MASHQFVILLRVEGGGSFHPRMDRVGSDHVELSWSGQDIMPRVIINDASAVVVQDMVVLFTKEFIRRRRDQAFQFANHDALYVRVQNKRAGRNAGAKP